MNAHAVQVERGYGRPVMSSFHAVFSLGGVAASLVGARTLGWGWSAPATLSGTAGVCLVAALMVAPALLPRQQGRLRKRRHPARIRLRRPRTLPGPTRLPPRSGPGAGCPGGSGCWPRSP